jgi:hypothetical protein
MPLQKIVLRPGINREMTRYSDEGGYYDCDKVRFRFGFPERIGGWTRISSATFLGVGRSLWNWTTLGALNLLGLGTNLKFYIENGGLYNDITPLRATNTLNGPFTTNGTNTVLVTDASADVTVGDFVTFSNATTVDGLDLNGNFQVLATPSSTTYTIDAGAVATGSTVSGGGSSVHAYYEVPVGSATAVPITGWGGGGWGLGSWGFGSLTSTPLRLWNQVNFGEDLIFGYRGGPLYYWDASIGYLPAAISLTIASPAVASTSIVLLDDTPVMLSTSGELPTGLALGTVYYVVNSSGTSFNLAATPGGTPITTSGTQSGVHRILARGLPLSSLAGASSVPTRHNCLIVSDTSRFVLVFGTTDIGSTVLDPMLIRWSAQENASNWAPSALNQAGSLRLSTGSEIITVQQSRQEILVWTDSALYSLQYLGPDIIWGSQILGDNISLIGPNAKATDGSATYWMGIDKFYVYDGGVRPLPCSVRRFVFSDINITQADQIFAGTNEGFSEIWWFYCSANSITIDRYVIYNHIEQLWYYGSLSRTAWLDSGLRDYPMAATYNHVIVNHEQGIDDNEGANPLPIGGYIQSGEFAIGDGNRFMFVWRMLPDITFAGSTAPSPTVTMSLFPLANSGSGYNDPDPGNLNQQSVSQTSFANVVRSVSVPVEKFTGEIRTRVRGRQMALRIESDQLGTSWQLGAPRIDMRPDGRR